ncbi:MAG: hypothetical protein NTW08_00595 [Gammaproteobacteria bacterium]|nr:hypothetical protein [Gammaproteobacteria bacterium]
MTAANRCNIFPRLHIGYDIAQPQNRQTTNGKLAHTIIQTLLSVETDYQFTLYPSFIDCWNDPQELNQLHILHSNNFWCPPHTLNETKLIYTLSDLSFLTNANKTGELNAIECFDGIFNASLCADWIIVLTDSVKTDFITLFPHFPTDRIQLIAPASKHCIENILALYHTAWITPKRGVT